MVLSISNPRAIFEELLYCFSILVSSISALFLKLDVLLSALVVFSFIMGFFFRGRIIPTAALIAFVAAVAVSPPQLTLVNLLVFGLFGLLPFFICFRTANAKSEGFTPVEPFGVLILIFTYALIFFLNIGFFFSSTDSILPHGAIFVSLIFLLSILVAVPLLVKVLDTLAGHIQRKQQ